ncbi:MAG TPA: 3-isopropylmalate dehydratase small subunit [Candidatus Omnitrophota bacterium]|nr:3-isopropylmalate dehydratase small subunit [Candidatus Omnitrophota bacterium]HPD85424.1 3-isopropylmalate dehydratase small subunit [Candidatus Omnitrophota bacterium]HRZ04075.1 3-isopropylmalate dehydratase small subunit [Candidatus Omnitrophota bacterium]
MAKNNLKKENKSQAKGFSVHTGLVVPLDRANIDTDAIIPKQFLRKIERTGFGVHLFHDWRYLDLEGKKENPDFILNQPKYRKATVLLARDNFGCGSSREHAPWALADYGFKVIIAPSFADIFRNNCIKNGILPVVLKTKEVDALFKDERETGSMHVTVDLKKQTVIGPRAKAYSFSINEFAKNCLIKGLDAIGWTEQFLAKIDAYEKKIRTAKPWLFKGCGCSK